MAATEKNPKKTLTLLELFFEKKVKSNDSESKVVEFIKHGLKNKNQKHLQSFCKIRCLLFLTE